MVYEALSQPKEHHREVMVGSAIAVPRQWKKEATQISSALLLSRHCVYDT